MVGAFFEAADEGAWLFARVGIGAFGAFFEGNGFYGADRDIHILHTTVYACTGCAAACAVFILITASDTLGLTPYTRAILKAFHDGTCSWVLGQHGACVVSVLIVVTAEGHTPGRCCFYGPV